MDILIINNHTKHLDELVGMMSQYGTVTVIDKTVFDTMDPDRALDDTIDLVVLSGGSSCPSVATHPDYYIVEMQLLRHTKIPIIGICLGAQIIAYTYHSSLERESLSRLIWWLMYGL